jgi:tRNA threonylcarbamoyladenosine biosynthesis protein TsaE
VNLRLPVPSADAMAELGQRIGARLQPGDVVLLEGPLGAGKTTLTRGIGAGLGVRGQVSSPTFVIARRHRPGPDQGGTGLLHVDAYRLPAAELADLELDLDLMDSAAVVEWGGGKAEDWSEDPLRVTISVTGPDPDAPRLVELRGAGARWDAVAAAVQEVT